MERTIPKEEMDRDITRKPQVVNFVLAILLGLIVGLLIIEICLRVLGLGYRNRPVEAHPVLHHVHPNSYLYRSHFGGHEVYYDEHGLVSDPDGKLANKSDCRIAFLGDSFTEARQVSYKNSFVGLLNKKTDCVVRNYGVASYSPIFYYIQWNHLINQWQPDLVIVQLYSNDIDTDLQYFEKAKLDAAGKPTAIPGPPRDWLSQQLRKSYLLRFLRKVQLTISWSLSHWGEEKNVVGDLVEEDPEISAMTSDLLLSLQDDITDAGASFVLLVVPSKFRLQNLDRKFTDLEFADKWKAWATPREINYIDLVGPFKDAAMNGRKLFFERDVHFNEDGHAVVADAIERGLPSVFSKDRAAEAFGN